MSIKVEVRDVYGNETIYPVCEKAVLFAQLKGQKTLTMRDIKIIKAIGFTIEVIPRQVNL